METSKLISNLSRLLLVTVQLRQCKHLGCIECMRCRLLLPMCAACVWPSVCLSRSSTRLHCAKVAKRIKMLFGVNTTGGSWNVALDGGADPHTEGREKAAPKCAPNGKMVKSI